MYMMARALHIHTHGIHIVFITTLDKVSSETVAINKNHNHCSAIFNYIHESPLEASSSSCNSISSSTSGGSTSLSAGCTLMATGELAAWREVSQEFFEIQKKTEVWRKQEEQRRKDDKRERERKREREWGNREGEG